MFKYVKIAIYTGILVEASRNLRDEVWKVIKK